MSLIKAVGIDLAKLVFSIHGVAKHSKCKLRKLSKETIW
jgi:transposase